MQGFYGVYYTGSTGRGAFGLLLHDGKVFGVDPTGGEISGTFTEREDGGVDLALTFAFTAGATLVTGQTLTQPWSIPANVTISAATLSGSGHQLVDLPMGRVNVRVAKKTTL